ncbi:O-antigen ligase domain-containing protein, partial [Staphylococcus warneri]
IQERIKAFLVKGQRSDQALYSRYIQIEYLMDALDKYPLFGGGFGIPVNNTSLDLLNFTFEAGNIFFALIIFTGIFGLICYLIYLVFMLFIVQH